MRRIHQIFMVWGLSIFGICPLAAQTTIGTPRSTHNTNIIEYLTTQRFGQGRIRLYQSPSISVLVKGRPTFTGQGHSGSAILLSGYKVQVYSGNGQNSKSIAQQRAALVRELLPDQETELTYNAPFWRVRVGNFLTQAEAHEYLMILKKEMPKIGKEMYVVRANIRMVE